MKLGEKSELRQENHQQLQDAHRAMGVEVDNLREVPKPAPKPRRTRSGVVRGTDTGGRWNMAAWEIPELNDYRWGFIGVLCIIMYIYIIIYNYIYIYGNHRKISDIPKI